MSGTRTCPSCAADNPVGAAFCSSCGRPSGGRRLDESQSVAPVQGDLPDTFADDPAPFSVSGTMPSISQDLGPDSDPDRSPDDAESLRTGAWHTMGASLDADIVVNLSGMAPKGVRLRRVGAEVEIHKVDPGVSITVDGEVVASGTFDVATARVEVDGVRISDQMLPLDTLDLGDVPDFFAPIVIGRSPDCDYLLVDDAVSGRHAGLSRQDGYLLLEDLDSANGTWVDDQRIKRARIGWRQPFEVGGVSLTPLDVVTTVRNARAASSTSVVTALSEDDWKDIAKGAAGLGASAQAKMAVGESLIVGRDAQADVVLDTPNVSRLHARLTRTPDGIEVEDLGSTNGTFVNGQRIRGRVVLAAGDDLRIGPQKLQLSADGTVTQDSSAKGVTGVRLDASKLIRKVGKGITVIDRLSFSILPGEMVAIMGPSGAGKTSALTTIAGYTPPSTGEVLIDGLDLYTHYDLFRRAIGYVPQEDVMHRTLTVEQVLYYQARLKFGRDVSDEEIDERIGTVLRMLDLEAQRTSLVGDEVRRGLSGGQRRRLNVAIELLSEPSLLLLDEPTSGLDARSAMQLIRQCRGLASAGRTVVMTIHQPRREAFDLFDKLLLLTKGGKLAYFGPAKEARRYFEGRSEVRPESARNPADFVLDVLDPLEPSLGIEPESWRKQFRKSRAYQRFVRNRLHSDNEHAEREAAAQERNRRTVRKAAMLPQLFHLVRRYAQLKWKDRSAMAVQLAQAPIIGLLAVLLFHSGRYMPLYLEDDITPTLFVVTAAAVWFGCSNVAREIVGERAIFRRERMGSLRSLPYLLSKLILQGLLVAVQVGMLLAILIPLVDLQGGVMPLFGVAVLAGCAAMAMGLLVSAIARTELQAIQLVPLVILPQIMLSGILLPVAGDKATVMATWLSKPVLLRWAYSAALHTEFAEATDRGIKSRGIGGAKYWDRNGFGGDTLQTDLLVMGGVGLLCIGITWLILARRDQR